MPKLTISDSTKNLRFTIEGNYTVMDLANLAAAHYLGAWYVHDLHGTDELSQIAAKEGTNRERDWVKERKFLKEEVFESCFSILVETHHFCGDMSHAFDAAFEADIEE